MSPLLPADKLRKLSNIRRINVAVALIAGLALAASMQDSPRVATGAIVLVIILNLVSTETLRATVADLRELRR